jgi:hypothetical protein
VWHPRLVAVTRGFRTSFDQNIAFLWENMLTIAPLGKVDFELYKPYHPLRMSSSWKALGRMHALERHSCLSGSVFTRRSAPAAKQGMHIDMSPGLA